VSRDVYVSTASFATRDLNAILDVCAAHEIECLELGDVASPDLSRIGVRASPSRFLVHNYFPPPDIPFVLNLASQDQDILERSRAHCRAAIDLSAALGGAAYAAHAGYAADIPPEVLGRPDQQASLALRVASREHVRRTLVESARSLAEYGRGRGVRFLVENHVLASVAGACSEELLPMTAPWDLVALCREVDHPGFGLLLDVGHLKVSAGTLGFDAHAALDELAGDVVAFHLSDNDGVADLHRAFGEEAWFLHRLRDFPDALMTVEIAPESIDAILRVRDTVAAWR
jgi:sugar phosphate isomerase/epimerase